MPGVEHGGVMMALRQSKHGVVGLAGHQQTDLDAEGQRALVIDPSL
jgi:hypothetical protein